MTDNLFGTRKFTGWHMAAVLGLFFGVIIAVNGIMTWQAIKAWPGLVVKNSYVASQEFNETTAALQAQIALGWQAETTFRDGQLTTILKDADGNPISGVEVTAVLGRPSTEAADQKITLTAIDIGTYSAPLALDRGWWNVMLNVHHDDQDWTRPMRLKVTPE